MPAHITTKEAAALRLETGKEKFMRSPRKAKKGSAEADKGRNKEFDRLCQEHGLPIPVAEYRFCEDRRWRFDFAWPEGDLALEIEGGVWIGGRHNRGSGFIRDLDKYNRAALEGWLVLRCTRKQFDSADPNLFDMLKKALL